MSVDLTRKTFTTRLSELIDDGIFTATSNNPYAYDAGMNFLGVLGEVCNHKITDRDVVIYCTWDGCVTPPLRYDDPEYYEKIPNILYDFNGSGNHYQNNDPRYILPIGSKGLLLTKVEFLKPESEREFWLSRQKNRIFKLLFQFKNKKKQNDWVKQKTESLNNSLKSNPKRIDIKPEPIKPEPSK